MKLLLSKFYSFEWLLTFKQHTELKRQQINFHWYSRQNLIWEEVFEWWQIILALSICSISVLLIGSLLAALAYFIIPFIHQLTH